MHAFRCADPARGDAGAAGARLRAWVLAILVAAGPGGTAVAGQECGEKAAATPEAIALGLQLGERVRDRLEASGASMALVARVGLNLSEYGQRYTHIGVALRDHVQRRWQVVHLFNACGGTDSAILGQALEQFFATQLYEQQALVLIPGYTNQARFRTAFMAPATARVLHQKAYNLISHPFSTQFQNSNQWVLEMLALGLAGAKDVQDRAQAQRWLQSQGYEPAGIRIPNLRRSAARLFSPHVHFSDHTQEEYEAQTYKVVTVDSIARFLSRLDSATESSTVR